MNYQNNYINGDMLHVNKIKMFNEFLLHNKMKNNNDEYKQDEITNILKDKDKDNDEENNHLQSLNLFKKLILIDKHNRTNIRNVNNHIIEKSNNNNNNNNIIDDSFVYKRNNLSSASDNFDNCYLNNMSFNKEEKYLNKIKFIINNYIFSNEFINNTLYIMYVKKIYNIFIKFMKCNKYDYNLFNINNNNNNIIWTLLNITGTPGIGAGASNYIYEIFLQN